MKLDGITRKEARTACEQIAHNRFWKRCHCEHDVGYQCDHCRRIESAPYDSEDLIDAYADWIFAMHVRTEEPSGDKLYPVFDTIDRLLKSGYWFDAYEGKVWLKGPRARIVTCGETFREVCLNIVFMGM